MMDVPDLWICSVYSKQELLNIKLLIVFIKSKFYLTVFHFAPIDLSLDLNLNSAMNISG